MGTYLAQPITDKKISEGESIKTKLNFTLCEMQGWRRKMEDSAITQLDLGDGNSLFAIFDGHGGPEVSLLLKDIFVQNLINTKQYKEKQYEDAFIFTLRKIDQFIRSDEGEKKLQEIRQLTNPEKKGFKTPAKSARKNERKSDQKFELKVNPKKNRTLLKLSENSKQIPRQKSKIKQKKEEEKISMVVGCTANMTLITPQNIIVANLGDSRSVLCRKTKSIPLSFDHKPENASQFNRIVKAGGKVIKGRINDGLNLSRSFGDFNYKKNKDLTDQQQMIICRPDIRISKRTTDDKFLFLGCDGVFEKYNHNEQALITRISNERKTKKKRSQILRDLYDSILAKDTKQIVGCDNMTSILVEFL